MSLRIAAPRPCYPVFFDDGASAPLSLFPLDEAGDFSCARAALKPIIAQPLAYDEQLGLAATIVDELGVVLGYTPIRAIVAQPAGDDGDLSFIYVDDDGALAFMAQPWSAQGQPPDADESLPLTAALTIVDEDGLIVGFIRQAQCYPQPDADDEVIGLANFFLDQDSQPLPSPLVAAAIKATWTDDDQLVITVSTAIDEDAWLPGATAQQRTWAQPTSADDALPLLGIEDDVYFYGRTAQSPVQFRVFTDDEQLFAIGPVDEDFFIIKPVATLPIFLPIFDSVDWTPLIAPLSRCAPSRTMEVKPDSRQMQPRSDGRLVNVFPAPRSIN